MSVDVLALSRPAAIRANRLFAHELKYCNRRDSQNRLNAEAWERDIRNRIVSGKAASVAELRQADLRSPNRPRAAFGLNR